MVIQVRGRLRRTGEDVRLTWTDGDLAADLGGVAESVEGEAMLLEGTVVGPLPGGWSTRNHLDDPQSFLYIAGLVLSDMQVKGADDLESDEDEEGAVY